MPMTLEEVVEYVHGRLVEAGPGREPDCRSVRMRVVTDSRQVEADGLFIAIKGEHVDGHDYVPGLGAKGCRAALVDHLDGALLIDHLGRPGRPSRSGR